MRKLLLVFGILTCLGHFARCQNREQLVIRDGALNTTQPLYILDNLVIDNPKDIDSSKIFHVTVLKGVEATALYGSSAAYGAILITTKDYAIKSYQKKLSEFSKQYKQFIEKDKKSDTGYSVSVTHFINGVAYTEGNKNTLAKLYNLPKENLKGVFIDAKFDTSYSPVKYYNIYITTKN